MVRVRHFIIALSLSLFPLGCTPAGCAGEDPDQDKTAAEQLAGAVEQALPAPDPNRAMLYGTWKGDMTGGHFTTLAVMTNQHFHSEQAIVCVKAPCNPAVNDGMYTLFAAEGRNYITFGEKTAPASLKYEYATDGNSLRLRPLVPGSEWYAMQRAEAAWCLTARECTVQNLPPGVCAGAYECQQSACVWKCARPVDPSAVEKADTTGK